MIEIQPRPPKVGETAKLVGIPGSKVRLDWDPPAEPSSLIIDSGGTVEFTVPAGVSSLVVVDEFGNRDSTTVSP